MISRHYFGSAETWMGDYIHKEILQTCPSYVSRGLPLKHIAYDGERPLLAASRHPNGAVAVAALGYLTTNGRYETPLCTVRLPEVAVQAPVGIFGFFKGVEIDYTTAVEGRRVFAQDLASSQAEDITGRVKRGATGCISTVRRSERSEPRHSRTNPNLDLCYACSSSPLYFSQKEKYP